MTRPSDWQRFLWHESNERRVSEPQILKRVEIPERIPLTKQQEIF